MKVALLGSAQCNYDDVAGRTFDFVIAVDAGLQHCEAAGVQPDLAVGDFDSLGYVPKDIEVLEFPHIKNESDLELACDAALERGASELYVYGALSGRLDHTFAAIQVMAGVARRGARVVGIGEDFAIVVLAGGAERTHDALKDGSVSPLASGPSATLSFSAFDPAQLSGAYAPYISLMALAGPVSGLVIEGLAYTVEDFMLPADVSRGLSNEFCGTQASIHFEEGVLIVIFPLDALRFARIDA